MADITISTKPEEKQPAVNESEIKEVLKAADDYRKLKETNDKIEQEIKRTVDLMRSKEMLGGRSFAGHAVEESPEEKTQKEAAEILKRFK